MASRSLRRSSLTSTSIQNTQNTTQLSTSQNNISSDDLLLIQNLSSKISMDGTFSPIMITDEVQFNLKTLFNQEVNFTKKITGPRASITNMDNVVSLSSGENQELTINNIKLANDQTIKLKQIKGTNNIVSINDVIIEDSQITANKLESIENVFNINNVLITKDKTVFVNKMKGSDGLGVSIEDVLIKNNQINTNTIQYNDSFSLSNNETTPVVEINDNFTTIQNTLKVDSIESNLNDSVYIGGLRIKNGKLDQIQTDEITTTRIKSSNEDLILNGNIILDNAKLSSGASGFSIDNVFFQNGEMFVSKISPLASVNVNTAQGIEIGGVSLNESNIVSEFLTVTDTINVQNIENENGVNVNEFEFNNKQIILPSFTGELNRNIKLYNENGQIKFELPDQSVYTPPTVTDWMNWEIYNNDSNVDITSNFTRFTLIDQSVWVNINVVLHTNSTLPNDYNVIWFSLPENYKSTKNKFQTFCIIENSNYESSIGVVYINGQINDDLIYFNIDDLIPNETYTIYANMVYEYKPHILPTNYNPWKTWFPIRKDTELKTIAVNNTRYYNIVSNVWISIDIDITMGSFTSFKTNTYISLPPNTHSKNIFFTNAALIESESDVIIGSISTGVSTADIKLGTNILRITNPDGFEANKKYRIKGQLIYESARTFFFDELEYNFGIIRNNDYSLSHNDNVYIEFLHNIDERTISTLDWLNYFIEDSFNVHIANNDGFSLYSQFIIQPFRNVSRIDHPWKIKKINDCIKLQFTVDGKTYKDQFVLCQNEEDPY